MYHWIDINKVSECDGNLFVTEVDNKIPFDIKRIFWIRDVVPGGSRGDHATKQTKLILIPVNGKCSVVMDDGKHREEVLLDDPKKGLYIDSMVWRKMIDFSDGAIIMAVCDRPFEPGNETYDDYNEYLVALTS